MGDVFFGENVKIYIDSTNPTQTTFDVSGGGAKEVQTSVFSFEISGGEYETETKPLLGNANIVIEKPASEIEVSMEVAIKTDDPTFWDKMFYGDGLTSATRADKCSIGIEATDGTTKYQVLLHNVLSVSFEKSLEAGDFLQGKITFKLAPTDDAGNANVLIGTNSNEVFTVQ